MDNRTPLDISLDVVTNSDTGELFIVAPEWEIAQAEKSATRSIPDTLAARRLNGEPPDRQVNVKKVIEQNITETYDRWRAESGEIRPKATKHRFDLKIPTHGQKLRCREAAVIQDPVTGARTQDYERYKAECLYAAFEPRPRAEVDDLHPQIAEELMARVMRAIHPDQNRLFFAASGSGNTSAER